VKRTMGACVGLLGAGDLRLGAGLRKPPLLRAPGLLERERPRGAGASRSLDSDAAAGAGALYASEYGSTEGAAGSPY
jgi:hypothetical protein